MPKFSPLKSLSSVSGKASMPPGTTSSRVFNRPAAIQQLKTVAGQVGADFFPSEANQNPVDIARNAVQWAKTHFHDVLIVDTAGRLAIDEAMMAEIKALHAALDPIETLFVTDAMQGQDAVNVAKAFGDALPLTTRELCRSPLPHAFEAHRAEGLLHASGLVGLAELLDAESEGDVLGDGQVREQRVVLKHHVQWPLGWTPRRQVVVPHDDPTRRGLFEAGDESQGRGLPTSTGAEQREELAGPDRQRNVGEDFADAGRHDLFDLAHEPLAAVADQRLDRLPGQVVRC